MPKDHYLFNLDHKKISSNYLNYNNLHYIFFDGSTELLNDERFKKIKKKTNIYYVGRLSEFWRNIENSQPLFDEDLNTLIKNIEYTKKSILFFIKVFLKNFSLQFLVLKNLD